MIAEKEKSAADTAVEKIVNDNFAVCSLLSSDMSKQQFREVVGADEKPGIDGIDPGVAAKVLSLTKTEKIALLVLVVARDEDRLAKLLDKMSVEQQLLIYSLLEKINYA